MTPSERFPLTFSFVLTIDDTTHMAIRLGLFEKTYLKFIVQHVAQTVS